MFQKKAINSKTLPVVIFFTTIVFAYYPYEFEINCPYWDIDLSRAGYIDITNWYPSERHLFGPHEMMTGDWAAAVWYDGIDTGNDAAWLTDEFVIPNIDPTNSPFDFSQPAAQAYHVQNDPCNPVWTDPCQPSNPPYDPYYKYDSGWSKIDDDKLEIKIHYEVVDLGEYGYSPLSYRDANDTPTFAYSERYVLLQTYVFKNIHATEDINDLEFYQMLHGHPAGVYTGNSGSYCATSFYDPLANYTPYDSAHKVGNFKYDMTIWNATEPLLEPNHFDWMSFSSTIEPNDFGLDDFTGESSGMGYAIKNRNLNGQTSISNSETAGAMMWYLGDIEPSESKSITMALMYGTENEQFAPVIITKTDDVNDGVCVEPYYEFHTLSNPDTGEITYTIDYNMADYNDPCVYILDELPDGVNYDSSDPCGTYDTNEHTVLWSLGAQGPNDTGSVELTVHVNYKAPPGRDLINRCYIYGDTFIKSAQENTCVQCWAGDMIFVDKDVNDPDNSNIGTSWADAFKDLQDGLDTAAECDCYTAIWVADGNYLPTESISDEDATFKMIDNIALIGHFAGSENDPNQRNLADANLTTTLQGQIGTSQSQAVQYVVTVKDFNDPCSIVTIDGFTIEGAYEGTGVFIYDSNVSLLNCKIRNNDPCGIWIEGDSFVDIFNCNFTNNYYGIDIHNNAGTSLDYCIFNNQTSAGITALDAILSINGSLFEDKSGLKLVDSNLTMDRCRIEDSNDCGIDMSSLGHYNSPGCELMISNSIICDNPLHGISLTDNKKTQIGNCWIYNNGTDTSGSGIYLDGDKSFPYIFNNTIYKNKEYGIKNLLSDGDPNIISCIIRDNTSGDLNGTFNCVHYNCLQSSHTGTENQVGDPCFYDEPCDLHITSASICKDKGYPDGSYLTGSNYLVLTKDIDGEPREYNRIDIGADEYYYSPADFNDDGIVNFFDYAVFSDAWQSASGTGDPNYNDLCDFEDNDKIDHNDLDLFAMDWLWETAWGGDPLPLRSSGGGDSLMLTSITESIEFQPAKLAAKTKKYYELTPDKTASAIQSRLSAISFNVQELLDWFDEVWKSGDLEDWDYDDYLDFRDSIKAAAEY